MVGSKARLFRKLAFGSMEFWMNNFKLQREKCFAVCNRGIEVSIDI